MWLNGRILKSEYYNYDSNNWPFKEGKKADKALMNEEMRQPTTARKWKDK